MRGQTLNNLFILTNRIVYQKKRTTLQILPFNRIRKISAAVSTPAELNSISNPINSMACWFNWEVSGHKLPLWFVICLFNIGCVLSMNRGRQDEYTYKQSLCIGRSRQMKEHRPFPRTFVQSHRSYSILSLAYTKKAYPQKTIQPIVLKNNCGWNVFALAKESPTTFFFFFSSSLFLFESVSYMPFGKFDPLFLLRIKKWHAPDPLIRPKIVSESVNEYRYLIPLFCWHTGTSNQNRWACWVLQDDADLRHPHNVPLKTHPSPPRPAVSGVERFVYSRQIRSFLTDFRINRSQIKRKFSLGVTNA